MEDNIHRLWDLGPWTSSGVHCSVYHASLKIFCHASNKIKLLTVVWWSGPLPSFSKFILNQILWFIHLPSLRILRTRLCWIQWEHEWTKQKVPALMALPSLQLITLCHCRLISSPWTTSSLVTHISWTCCSLSLEHSPRLILLSVHIYLKCAKLRQAFLDRSKLPSQTLALRSPILIFSRDRITISYFPCFFFVPPVWCRCYRQAAVCEFKVSSIMIRLAHTMKWWPQ